MGGLSGQPVKELAIKTVAKFYQLTKGSVPIIGCGGVRSAEDAVRFARAGASMVQLYTSLGYAGPGIVSQIKQDLFQLLQKENRNWKDLVGADHKQ
jgi:dihydroorotate dehydrogenase